VKIVALTGGVGGARLVDGLAQVLPAEDLTVVVNTGDDFVHWGLTICPDLDTVMYTLAGLADAAQGWGIAGESFGALAMVERYRGAVWFRLGDRDLATHLMRSEALARGTPLTAITRELAGALGVGPRLLPMADAPRPTMLDTADGTLAFQDWLVRRRARPAVTRVWSAGTARPTAAVLDALAAADAVVIGPSNPYVSIDPILNLEGVRAALAGRPVVAVSPIVGGRAVKGPLAAMMMQLTGRPASATAIAEHYGSLCGGLVHERGDAPPPGLPALATATVIPERAGRARLAAEVLAFAEALR
jgi:LPPG:FO 2-phospho-L-lactate transferase